VEISIYAEEKEVWDSEKERQLTRRKCNVLCNRRLVSKTFNINLS